MENYMTGILVASAVLNIVLFVRGKIWKSRTLEYGDMLSTMSDRLKLAFNMLVGVAEERGVDKQEFQVKMLQLSKVPEELQSALIEKVLPPSKASANSDSHIGFN